MRERETVLCGLVWRGVVCGAVCSLRSQAYDVREQTVGVFYPHCEVCRVGVCLTFSLHPYPQYDVLYARARMSYSPGLIVLPYMY